MMGEEKRKYLRFECLLPVELIEIKGEPGAGLKGNIENVSREGLGLLFNLGLNFEPGAAIGFKMYNPELKKDCQVKGEITWSKLAGNKIEVGLKIVSMETCTKAELLDLGFNLWRDKQAKNEVKKKL